MRSLRIPSQFTVDDPRIEPCPTTGCWLWTGPTLRGYGRSRARIDGKMRSVSVHRAAWIFRHGPVASGMVLDHLCRNRACANPDHLRVVTPRINSIENSVSPIAVNAQKSHCIYGHPFSGENLYVSPRGYRGCRTCMAERVRRAQPAAKARKAYRRRTDPAYASHVVEMERAKRERKMAAMEAP